MTVLLKIFLILKFITGTHSIETISRISVKYGTSVTIPCLYESKYKNNVKYLCKGTYWDFCSSEIKTNELQNSQKYSISDDKNQKIFSVTIQDMADKNTYYWCAVEINGPDDKQYFYLSGTPGTSRLYVDSQMVTGFIGEDITINCYYNYYRTSGEMKWCKLGKECVTKESELIDGTRVSLNNKDNRFTVTLSGLSAENSGWYYCLKGDYQMPVHLTVTEKPAEKYDKNEVSKVSVKAGASLSVPCLYDSKYRNNVKYFCEGKSWSSCSSSTKRDMIHKSQEHLISDEKDQTIFVVNITELTDKNTYYWCAVEIKNTLNIGQIFQLSVTNSSPELYVVNQRVSGFIGENITINCHYTISGEMKWCKLGKKCVTNKSGLIDGTRVNLNMSIRNVFSVTLSELSAESSGWYYCVNGDFQMPVHLTVSEKTTVVATAVSVTEIGAFTIQGKTTIGLHVENEQNRGSVNLKGLIISLSLLIIIGLVVLFIWFKIGHKHTNEDSTTTKSSEEVTYSDVRFKKTKAKAAQGLSTDTDEGVIYSCVVQSSKSEDKVLDVTYSTLTCQTENI